MGSIADGIKSIVVTFGVASCFVMVVVAQKVESPAFRSVTRIVTVDVVVQDRHGRPLLGLTSDDFKVRDRGTVQAVLTCQLIGTDENRPARHSDRLLPNWPLVQGSGPARAFALLLDDYHLGLPQVSRVSSAATEFVSGALSSEDSVAVYLPGESAADVPFPQDRTFVLAKIAGLGSWARFAAPHRIC